MLEDQGLILLHNLEYLRRVLTTQPHHQGRQPTTWLIFSLVAVSLGYKSFIQPAMFNLEIELTVWKGTKKNFSIDRPTPLRLSCCLMMKPQYQDFEPLDSNQIRYQ